MTSQAWTGLISSGLTLLAVVVIIGYATYKAYK